MLIDTHSHIYEKDFEQDIAQVLERAEENGVKKILLPNVDCSSVEPLLQLCEKHEGLYPMMGLHPTSVNANWAEELDTIKKILFENPSRFCAIGEIGLDLYWDRTFVAEQIEVFSRQMRWSFELSLPVCIHIRKAFDELFASLKTLNRKTYNGVLHCFGGDVNQAKRLIEMGFKIGIGGVLTFKNAHLAEVVSQISIDDIVLETDSPYLAPVPFRGKRNESSYVLHIAKKVSEIKNIPLEEVAERTTETASRLFNL